MDVYFVVCSLFVFIFLTIKLSFLLIYKSYKVVRLIFETFLYFVLVFLTFKQFLFCLSSVVGVLVFFSSVPDFLVGIFREYQIFPVKMKHTIRFYVHFYIRFVPILNFSTLLLAVHQFLNFKREFSKTPFSAIQSSNFFSGRMKMFGGKRTTPLNSSAVFHNNT